jgi:predicted thioesterase
MQVGETFEETLVVGPDDTAKALARSPEEEFPAVFATTRMIGLMELAAAKGLRPLLGPGQLSVGVGVDVKHLAATPVGVEVRAVATYLGPEGKLHRFRVQAFDRGGVIGEGTHTRAIIDAERLVIGARGRNPT